MPDPATARGLGVSNLPDLVSAQWVVAAAVGPDVGIGGESARSLGTSNSPDPTSVQWDVAVAVGSDVAGNEDGR
jgi:hypothetical protein